MGQGGGKETPVLPLLPVQLILESNFPCPQQRDARRAELGRTPSLTHSVRAPLDTRDSKIALLGASAQLHFLFQDRDISSGEVPPLQVTHGHKKFVHPRAGARCPRGPGSAGSGHEQRPRERGAPGRPRNSPGTAISPARPGPAPPARTAGTGQGRSAPSSARGASGGQMRVAPSSERETKVRSDPGEGGPGERCGAAERDTPPAPGRGPAAAHPGLPGRTDGRCSQPARRGGGAAAWSARRSQRRPNCPGNV